MEQTKYTFEELLRQVNRFMQDKMNQKEEIVFLHDVRTDKKLGKIVLAICIYVIDCNQRPVVLHKM